MKVGFAKALSVGLPIVDAGWEVAVDSSVSEILVWVASWSNIPLESMGFMMEIHRPTVSLTFERWNLGFRGALRIHLCV